MLKNEENNGTDEIGLVTPTPGPVSAASLVFQGHMFTYFHTDPVYVYMYKATFEPRVVVTLTSFCFVLFYEKHKHVQVRPVY